MAHYAGAPSPLPLFAMAINCDRFALILANALFLQTVRRDDV
jgi:hypothetical protein